MRRGGASGAVGTLAAALLATAVPAAVATPARVARLGGRIAPVGRPTTSTVAHFDLSAAVPSGDEVTAYSVTFGDVSHKLTASASSGLGIPKSVTHRYGRPGRYLVTFRLSDSHKRTVTATTHVIVGRVVPVAGSGSGPIAVGVPVRSAP